VGPEHIDRKKKEPMVTIDDPLTPPRLTLELRSEGAGVAGSLYDEHGAQHRFTGWLGLLTLLEAARLRSQHNLDREGRR
jgi:hypothetical protein